jgi:hypothetical protein
LEITNAIFSALPTFAMSTFLLPKTVIKQIDKFRKHCLWRGSDINNRKPPKAAWPLVCAPKPQGGLGVLDLRTHNECLLLKHLHKFYNRLNIPWVWDRYYSGGRLPRHTNNPKGSFWWRDILKLLESFKSMAQVQVRDGKSCFFWLDHWNDLVLVQAYPELHSFSKNNHFSVHSALNLILLPSLFHLPLSTEAFGQFQEVEVIVQNTHLQDQPDQWSYSWGSSIFSSSKAYKALIGHQAVHPVYRWLWKSSCQNKRKIFFWLLLKDRLSTRDLLQRRNMFLPDYSCVHCSDATLETLPHLLFDCPFALACWNTLLLNVSDPDDALNTVVSFRA